VTYFLNTAVDDLFGTFPPSVLSLLRNRRVESDAASEQLVLWTSGEAVVESAVQDVASDDAENRWNDATA
jgi:hypothetical protein